VENLKLFIEMAHGKQASDKLFNEINWLIVHSLKAGYSVDIFIVKVASFNPPIYCPYSHILNPSLPCMDAASAYISNVVESKRK
jgi:hypothetical protein